MRTGDYFVDINRFVLWPCGGGAKWLGGVGGGLGEVSGAGPGVAFECTFVLRTKKYSHAFGERGQVGGHVGEAPAGAVDGGADARAHRGAAGGGSGDGGGRPQQQQQQRRTHSTQLTSHHQQLDSTRHVTRKD
jgi:hypothetical protein